MEEEITQQLKEIPDVLREHIISSALSENIEEILKDHPLQNVQRDAFEREILLVLLQLSSVEEFTVNIKHNMEIAMKRAEEISKRTKQLIFLPVQDYLVQRAVVENEDEEVVGDGVATPQTIAQGKNDAPKRIQHEIPLQDIEKKKSPEPKEEHPLIAEAPREVVPTAKERVLQKPTDPVNDSTNQEPATNIFKQRLEQPVHTPTEENRLGDSEERVANTNPSSHKEIAADPYKESIE